MIDKMFCKSVILSEKSDPIAEIIDITIISRILIFDTPLAKMLTNL